MQGRAGDNYCLRRAAPNTNEQRSRNGLRERVIRREATETEGLVCCMLEQLACPKITIIVKICIKTWVGSY